VVSQLQPNEELDESLKAFGFRHATRVSRKAENLKLQTSVIEHVGKERAKT